jgi:flavin-dependent dehydrogenase
MSISVHSCPFIPDRAAGSRRPVHVIGGGLAGLALGIALRRQGVPVVIHEAGHYPRHRVCGEFVSGLNAGEIEALRLEEVFSGVPRHRRTAWFRGDRLMFERELPEPALAISRYELDAAMARQFMALGGVLRCGERLSSPQELEGWIGAAGRVKRVGRWLGLKAHFTGLPLRAGLEMHLGRGGYAGVTELDRGRVNVCALLPPAMPGTEADKSSLLAARLEAIGLHSLGARLRAATCDRESVTGVTHFSFGWQKNGPERPALGDQMALIPPFTGHGMTMALQGALTAAPFLEAWSRGRGEWPAALRAAQVALHRRFAARLRWAAALHPFLLRTGGQAMAAALERAGLLPFTWLFHRVR